MWIFRCNRSISDADIWAFSNLWNWILHKTSYRRLNFCEVSHYFFWNVRKALTYISLGKESKRSSSRFDKWNTLGDLKDANVCVKYFLRAVSNRKQVGNCKLPSGFEECVGFVCICGTFYTLEAIFLSVTTKRSIRRNTPVL